MPKNGPQLTSFDELSYSIERFQIEVNELYKQDKLIFTNDNYRQLFDYVNDICERLDCSESCNSSTAKGSNKRVYEEIAKSMEDIKEDLEEAIKDIEKEEKFMTRRPRRSVSIKFFDYWEKLLDKQSENELEQEQQSVSGKRPNSSFVQRRIQQFDKKDRRKSSTVYSLANIRTLTDNERCSNELNNFLTKAHSMNVICDEESTTDDTERNETKSQLTDLTDIYTFVTAYERNNSDLDTSPTVKPKIVGGLLKKSGSYVALK